LRYCRDYEEFTVEFFQSRAAFERVQELYKAGQTDKARAAIGESDPRRAIEQYVAAASHSGMTGGEQALIISLNLRWLPYIVSLRQALGLDAARFKFQPTQHEPLAQGSGSNTFWFDERRSVWKALGEKESGAPVFANAAAGDEICRSGIRIDTPLTLKLTGIMGDRLVPGRYRVGLMLSGNAATVEMRGALGPAPVSQRIDPTGGAPWTSAPLESPWAYSS
jgi:hypothetical protein